MWRAVAQVTIVVVRYKTEPNSIGDTDWIGCGLG